MTRPHLGPSPRVRGERTGTTGSCDRSAGHPRVCGENPAAQGSGCGLAAGHPRVCGENKRPGVVAALNERAIPACAGRTVASGYRRRGFGRAIPACAGRTSKRSVAAFILSGHPRVCGENAGGLIGSRGHQRAIPACAGRTNDLRACGLAAVGPSPRVRGERPRQGRRAMEQSGHPRVCGENVGSGGGVMYGYSRAIPACAGRTRPRRGPRYLD